MTLRPSGNRMVTSHTLLIFNLSAVPPSMSVHCPLWPLIAQIVALYLNATLDESYTPQLLSVRVGNTHYDLVEIKSVQVPPKHVGWLSIQLTEDGFALLALLIDSDEPIAPHFLQLAILANHLGGRDSHVRLMKVFGPKKANMAINMPHFTAPEFTAYETIR